MIDEELKEKLVPIFDAISTNSNRLFELRFEELVEKEISDSINEENQKKLIEKVSLEIKDIGKTKSKTNEELQRIRDEILLTHGLELINTFLFDFEIEQEEILINGFRETYSDDLDKGLSKVRDIEESSQPHAKDFDSVVSTDDITELKKKLDERRGELIQSKLDGFFDAIVSNGITPEMIQKSIGKFVDKGDLDKDTEKKTELLKVFECAVELFSKDTKEHIGSAISSLEKRKKEAIDSEENKELIQKVKDRKNQAYKIAFYVRMCDATISYAKNLNRWCDAMGIENHGSKKVRQITLGDFIHVMNANGQLGQLETFKANWQKTEGYSLDIS